MCKQHGNLRAIRVITYVPRTFDTIKIFIKHTNMGSSSEGLVKLDSMVKTDVKSDRQFELLNILNFQNGKIIECHQYFVLKCMCM